MKKDKTGKLFNFTLILFSTIAVAAIGAFAIYNYYISREVFYKNTTINGVMVGGMNIVEASNAVEANYHSFIKDINVTLKYEDKQWNYCYKDFEVVDDISPLIADAYNTTTSNNIFERRAKIKQHKKNNGIINISYRNMLGGFAEKLNYIENEIYQELKEPQVEFNPNNKSIFNYISGQDEILVNRQELEKKIDTEFAQSKKIIVEIPTIQMKPQVSVEDLKNQTCLRSSFSTNYSNSSSNRKSNIKTALSSFNGKIIMPEEEVSFNNCTGARTSENGYKPANIILNGMYVEGSGGGVCQASTTLYNAVLLANLEVLEVTKHSLPASYVPLGLDAMVSEGVSDLRFKNNTSQPIYIKTWCDSKTANVEIYGLGHENGEYYKTRSEFIKTLPHGGDRIVKDENGEYSNKVTFKGEYLRLKYPHEGYEANVYLQKYSASGEILEEKLIRHEIYNPQEGIIIEGTEELFDGISLPPNNVKFIPPQVNSSTNKGNVESVISGNHNEKYNP